MGTNVESDRNTFTLHPKATFRVIQTRLRIAAHYLAAPSTARVLSPSFLIFYCCVVCTSAFGDDSGKDLDQRKLELRCEIQLDEFNRPTAHADLGTVDPSEILDLTFLIENRIESELRYSDTLESCACRRIRPATGVIRPKATGKIQVEWQMPAVPTMAVMTGVIRFTEGKTSESFRLVVRYRFDMHASITAQFVLLTTSEHETEQHLVPMVIGDRVNREKDLKLAFQPANELVSLDLVRQNDKEFCRITVKPLPTASLSGKLVVANTTTGRSQSTGCIIERAQLVTVAPKIARFVASDAAESTATFFVRRKQDPTPETDEKSDQDVLLFIDASLAGLPLKQVKQERLSEGIYRVKVTLDTELLESLDRESKLDLRVRSAEKSVNNFSLAITVSRLNKTPTTTSQGESE